jgi:hypothetical protein
MEIPQPFKEPNSAALKAHCQPARIGRSQKNEIDLSWLTTSNSLHFATGLYFNRVAIGAP